jgi:xanthine dehydrogenase accessory factor
VRGLFDRLKQLLEEDCLVGVATRLDEAGLGRKALFHPDGSVEGDLGLAGDSAATVAQRCRELLEARRSAYFDLAGAPAGEPAVEVFFEVLEPLPRLVVVGAVHVAIPLVTIAKTLGFHTVVVDARAVYATRERFPHADELIVEWPAKVLERMRLHEATYCVFLTHDEKLDNPALRVALSHPVRYIGALGSKKTHAKRVAALQADGVDDEALARIHAPIGLDLGGRRPEEIALAIAAELVASRYGRA